MAHGNCAMQDAIQDEAITPLVTKTTEQRPELAKDAPVRTTTTIAVPAAQPILSANPTIVDGTLLTVAFASLAGVVKMSAPFFGSLYKTRQDAKLQAMAENRKAELDNEAATGATMRALLERGSEAAIAMNKQATDALTGRVMTTLDLVVQRLTELGGQIGKVAESQQAIAETQQSISETQLRTIQILTQLEAAVRQTAVLGTAKGRRADDPAPEDELTD